MVPEPPSRAARSCPQCAAELPPGVDACPRHADATAVRDPLVGQKLGDYVIQGWIGAGGMGVVYKATQPVIGKTVAIKVLRREIAEDPEQMERLLNEARTVNAIRHRGIVDIFTFGSLPGGGQYLVMEFLEGDPLDVLIEREAPMVPLGVVDILDDIFDALGAAHGAGVVHRDLKPGNIIVVSPPSGVRFTKLLDFGLAKQGPRPHGTTPQTHASAVVGTPHYMAPEQARGQPVGPQTDLYAMGCVAFEMLTGRPPFVGDNLYDLMRQHVSEPPPRPSSLARDVPEDLSHLVVWLMAKSMEERPASAQVVRQELKRIRWRLQTDATALSRSSPRPQPIGDRPKDPAGAPRAAAPSTAVMSPREGKPARKVWLLAGVATLLFAAAGGLGAWRFSASSVEVPAAAPSPLPRPPAPKNAPTAPAPTSPAASGAKSGATPPAAASAKPVSLPEPARTPAAAPARPAAGDRPAASRGDASSRAALLARIAADRKRVEGRRAPGWEVALTLLDDIRRTAQAGNAAATARAKEELKQWEQDYGH